MSDYTEQRLIDTLVIDIETIPSGEPLSIEELKEQAPKNYKNDDAKEKWAQANLDTEYKKRALDSLKGRVLCIGYKWNDNPVEVIPYHENEKVVLEAFQNVLKAFESKLYAAAIIGHNYRRFDNLWLVQRAYKYQLKNIIRLLPTDKFDKRLVDTNDMFNLGVYGEYTSLKDICDFLDIPTSKDDIDGSEVYDVFMKGELERIYTYCGKDVDRTYACYNRMLP